MQSVVLITGASAGIGRSLAYVFASKSHNLLLVARGEARLAEIADEIRQSHSVDVHELAIDVSQDDAHERVLEFARSRQLQIDILVNNAAGFQSGPIRRSDAHEAIGLLQTNIVAPYALTRALLPDMVARGAGKILNVGSLAGEVPAPGVALYSSSKTFLKAFTLALRDEVSDQGIAVSLLAPGLVDTEFTNDGTRQVGSPFRALLSLPPDLVAQAGYRGLMAGQAIIVPGLVARMTYLGLRLIPQSLAIRLRALSPLNVNENGAEHGFHGRDADRPRTSHLSSAVVGAEPDAAPRSQNIFEKFSTWLLASPVRGLIFLFCLIAIISGNAAHDKIDHKDLPRMDGNSGLIASEMLKAGARSDGGAAQKSRVAEASIAPGYAFILYTVGRFSPSVSAAIECRVNQKRCDENPSFAPVVVLQLVMAIFAMLILFAAAWRMSGSWEVATLTLILAYIGIRLGDFAGLVRPLTWLPVVTFAGIYLAVEAYLRQSPAIALLCGLAMGFACLFMPLMILVVPITAFTMMIVRGPTGRRAVGVLNGLLIGVGAALIALLVNYMTSYSYDPITIIRHVMSDLSERVAYNAMDFETYLASLLLPVPLFGGLANFIFSEQSIKLIAGLHHAGTFAHHGIHEIYPSALSSSDLPQAQLSWLVKNHVTGQFLSYLSVIPAVIVRGIWAGAGILGLVGIFHIKPLFSYHNVDGRLGVLLIAFVPIIALFILNVLFTGNHFYLNPGLTFLYAYAVAYVAGRF